MAALIVLTSISVLSLFSLGCVAALSFNYYDKTCPNVESSISNSVKSAATKDRTVIPALLRMHFHDCFIRGCDGSILLDSEGTNKAEKDAAPNGSLHAFFVIDGAKKELEAQCPGVVSCADILAVAARDAVVLVTELIISHPSMFRAMRSKFDFLVTGGRADLGSAKGKKRWEDIKSKRDSRAAIAVLQHISAPAELRSEGPLH
ncbi:hypothetical protein SAY87_029090 [Trapa incisa]|uniref:peroxidase n=1 Tax=Trapa incisa TaxID=236973 RepID=A0AAN7KVZ6_9MYRT|nr:hypothetical protein SAY87_029090 [Trapa incisa]